MSKKKLELISMRKKGDNFVAQILDTREGERIIKAIGKGRIWEIIGKKSKMTPTILKRLRDGQKAYYGEDV